MNLQLLNENNQNQLILENCFQNVSYFAQQAFNPFAITAFVRTSVILEKKRQLVIAQTCRIALYPRDDGISKTSPLFLTQKVQNHTLLDLQNQIHAAFQLIQ